MSVTAELIRERDAYPDLSFHPLNAAYQLVNSEMIPQATTETATAHLLELCGIFFAESEGTLHFDSEAYIEFPTADKTKRDNRLWRLNGGGRRVAEDMYQYLITYASQIDAETLLRVLLDTYYELKKRCQNPLQQTAILRVIGSVRGKILAAKKMQLFSSEKYSKNSTKSALPETTFPVLQTEAVIETADTPPLAEETQRTLEKTLKMIYKRRHLLAAVQGGFNYNVAVKRLTEVMSFTGEHRIFVSYMKTVITTLAQQQKIDQTFAENMLRSVRTGEYQFLKSTDGVLDVKTMPTWPPEVAVASIPVPQKEPQQLKPREPQFFPKLRRAFAGVAAILMAH